MGLMKVHHNPRRDADYPKIFRRDFFISLSGAAANHALMGTRRGRWPQPMCSCRRQTVVVEPKPTRRPRSGERSYDKNLLKEKAFTGLLYRA